MINYLTVISRKFPNVLCHVVGDQSIYENIVWSGGQPLPSKQELDIAALVVIKEDKKHAINELRTEKFAAGFTDSKGIKWGCTPVDISNLTAVCTLISLGAVTQNQVWRDFNNVDHTMTPTEIITLAGEMAAYGRSIYTASWTHKANIDALTTINEVLSYDITVGWPS